MINTFFLRISDRFYKENDISDITWAIIESSNLFKNFFMKFFWQDFTLDSKNFKATREFSKYGSRPDFFIENGNDKFIIEVKKYDRNYHFDQYKKDFPDCKFAFISIYKPPYQESIVTKTWKEFISYLENRIKYIPDETNEKEIIKGYINYIKGVCEIMEYKKLNFSNVKTIFYFLKLIEREILVSDEELEFSVDKKSKGFTEDKVGYYFYASKKGGEKLILCWFGYFFGWSDNAIYIEVIEWNKEIIKLFENNNLNSDFKYSENPLIDNTYNNSIWFRLKEEYNKLFHQDNSTVENQIEILKSFVKEVSLFLINKIEEI